MSRHGSSTEKAFLFPSHPIASRCAEFMQKQVSSLVIGKSLRLVDLYPNSGSSNGKAESETAHVKPIISAVVFPQDYTKIAKTFWQHSGDGVSSRRAEYCHRAFDDGRLTIRNTTIPPTKGPRRYQKKESIDNSIQCEPVRAPDRKDYLQFVEERFGRNLDISLACNAKQAIRRRIAGALTANVDLHEALEMAKPSTRTEHVEGFSEHDVYLYPCGMSSIFNTHRVMMACRGEMKSISFGYPSQDDLISKEPNLKQISLY